MGLSFEEKTQTHEQVDEEHARQKNKDPHNFREASPHALHTSKRQYI